MPSRKRTKGKDRKAKKEAKKETKKAEQEAKQDKNRRAGARTLWQGWARGDWGEITGTRVQCDHGALVIPNDENYLLASLTHFL